MENEKSTGNKYTVKDAAIIGRDHPTFCVNLQGGV